MPFIATKWKNEEISRLKGEDNFLKLSWVNVGVRLRCNIDKAMEVAPKYLIVNAFYLYFYVCEYV